MEPGSSPTTPAPPALRDLPRSIWLGVPIASWLIFLPIAFFSPAATQFVFQGDLLGGGIVENGTFVILLPGIIAGLAAFLLAQRRRLTWERYWFLCWTLACIYFAGEEISWGQHYFKWSTPEFLESANDQQETNLHNISSWLDQKPRALVEAGILVGGLLVPLWQLIRKSAFDPSSWAHWIWPTIVCAPAAAAEILTRVFEAIHKRTFDEATLYLGSAELREFFVALFLTIYLLSAWRRLLAKPAPSS